MVTWRKDGGPERLGLNCKVFLSSMSLDRLGALVICFTSAETDSTLACVNSSVLRGSTGYRMVSASAASILAFQVWEMDEVTLVGFSKNEKPGKHEGEKLIFYLWPEETWDSGQLKHKGGKHWLTPPQHILHTLPALTPPQHVLHTAMTSFWHDWRCHPFREEACPEHSTTGIAPALALGDPN